jgi:hypothetical protein
MQGTVEVGQGNDGAYVLNEQPMLGDTIDTSELGIHGDPIHVGPTVEVPAEQGIRGVQVAPNLTMDPRTLRRHLRDLPMDRRYQGSYLQRREAAIKESDVLQQHLQPTIEEIMARAQELAARGVPMATAVSAAERLLLREKSQQFGQPRSATCVAT